MIKINWLDVKIDGKVYKRIMIVGIAISVIYVLVTLMSFALPRVYHLDKNTKTDTEHTIKNGILNLYRGSLRLEILGWAYKEGQSIETFKSSFILKNRENEKMYLLKTGMELVEENQFVDGHECLKSGLKTESIVLGLPNAGYDLYILYQNDREDLLVDTGVEVNL